MPHKISPAFQWFFLLLAIACVNSQGQQPTKEDSGWVSLFNGTNLDGFYPYFQGVGAIDMAKQDAFIVEQGMIHVPKVHAGGYTALEGHLITLKQYSWYKIRVDYKFSTDINSQNAGLVIHIDNDAALIGHVTGPRPRSIEINMRRLEESPWTFWSAVGLGPYITTTVKSGSANFQTKADGGVNYTNDPWGDRVIRSTYPNPNHQIVGTLTFFGCYMSSNEDVKF